MSPLFLTGLLSALTEYAGYSLSSPRPLHIWTQILLALSLDKQMITKSVSSS